MLVRILSGSQRGLVLEMAQVNAEHAIQTGYAEKVSMDDPPLDHASPKTPSKATKKQSREKRN